MDHWGDCIVWNAWEKNLQVRKNEKRCFESKQWMKHTLEICKREMKIQKEINLFMGYQINVPMIAGLFHPCIFLPVKEFTEEELEICLYHELNHYKKHDILWNYLSSGIVCIHWYFPLVRKVWRDMDQWSEISCDIRSIAYVGSMKKYFSMILKMSEETSGFQTYTMACLFENTSLLEKRMIYVKRYISRGRSKVIFMFILLFIFFMAGGVSIYAMTDKYHHIYVDWVQEKTVEVEESKDNNPSYKKMKEMKGKLRKDQVEKIVKANLKGDEMIPINHTIGANGRILYKNIYVKKGQKIDISTARNANNHKIRIGISCDDKEVRYVEDEGEDEVSHIFNINYEGKYDVYIENMSDKKIKIIGVLAIILEGERE